MTWLRLETATPASFNEAVCYPIRITQVLFSVWSQQRKNHIKGFIEPLTPDHEWVKWASESVDNYETLWNLGMDLLDEHAELYGNVAVHPYRHGSYKFMEELGALPPLPSVGLTASPEATV